MKTQHFITIMPSSHLRSITQLHTCTEHDHCSLHRLCSHKPRPHQCTILHGVIVFVVAMMIYELDGVTWELTLFVCPRKRCIHNCMPIITIYTYTCLLREMGGEVGVGDNNNKMKRNASVTMSKVKFSTEKKKSAATESNVTQWW